MRFVLLGAPGAGKGTFAVFLENKLDIPKISTGDLFRSNLDNKTELGKLAVGYMSKGALVPDDITCEMVAARLKEPDTANGFILDGFPRTCAQADVLEKILAEADTSLDLAIEVTCTEDVIVSRLNGRRVCTNCGRSYNVDYIPPVHLGFCDTCCNPLIQREDDKLETVLARLRIYHKKTAPLLDFYMQRKLLLTVDNAGEVIQELPEQIQQLIC